MAAVETAAPGKRRRLVALPGRGLEIVSGAGKLLLFVGEVLAGMFNILVRRRYLNVVAQQISDVVVGAGAYIAGGGMVFVIGVMSMAVGATVGLQGFNGLSTIGAESYTGLVASFGSVREVTPIIAGVALAAQVGSSFTAEIGVMRISDEIDALEVMGIPSQVYLISTRMLATIVALVPLYAISLFASFAAARFITTSVLGMSTGLYDNYFYLYLPPVDVFYSITKVLVFAVIVVIIHCWYGYHAFGGPAGVGIAVGKAIRASIMAIVIANLLLSFLFWGNAVTVSVTG